MGVIYWHLALNEKQCQRIIEAHSDYKRSYVVWVNIVRAEDRWLQDSDKAARAIHDALVENLLPESDLYKLRSRMFFGGIPLFEKKEPNIRYLSEFPLILSSVESIGLDYFKEQYSDDYAEYAYLWFQKVRDLYIRALEAKMPAILFMSDQLRVFLPERAETTGTP
ncbi:MAG: hypothetical protein F9K24_13710 [Leptonema illini]|uniref:Uncharacterized protein n=1 Tax=Leptonema illini TaxID=183 RepID=A0A833H0A3_9LEPT|nr:MAG: hypothetical protein F9K24_13710 [Leptonema illini]